MSEVEPTSSRVVASRTNLPRIEARHSSRAVVAALAATTGLVSAARADVLEAHPPRTDCPQGARSALAGEGHSEETYCAPSLAFGGWPCVDGRRLDVVGLQISSRHVLPAWDRRAGPMPPEVAAQARELAVADGPCVPTADAPILELPAEIALAAVPAGSVSGPPTSLVPPGCQRVRVWISDPSFTCPHTESVVAPVVSSPAPPPPPSSGCACAASAPRTSSGVASPWIALLLVLRIGAGRDRTVRRRLRAAAWLSMLLVAAPSLARADAVSPAPECPAGQSRGAGPLTGLGFYGHRGAPPCQPAVCSELVPCPESHVCRRDTHCIIERTTHELRETHGHGQRFDPADPASWTDVTRSYDLGACDEGQCPSGARCLAVSTCRAPGETDTAVIATSTRGGSRAAAAWASGVPYSGTEASLEPPATTGTLEPPTTTGTLEPPTTTGTLEPPATTSAPATTPPPAPPTSSPAASSGLCTATGGSRRGSPSCRACSSSRSRVLALAAGQLGEGPLGPSGQLRAVAGRGEARRSRACLRCTSCGAARSCRPPGAR